MPATPEFDRDDTIREAFTMFRSTPLPPSAYSADGARATVRHRRRVRITVAAVAVALAVVVPVTAVAFAASTQHRGGPPVATAPPPGPSATSSGAPSNVPSATPSSAPSSASAPVDDLTVTASPLVTNGSVGTPTGWTDVTIRNRGPAAVDQVNVTFHVGSGIRPTTTAAYWTGCSTASDGATVTCPRPAPPVGGVRRYVFTFTVPLSQGGYTYPTLTVQPRNGTDPNPADNTVQLSVCTNGCYDRGPDTDIAMTVGKLLTNGSAGTVTGTLQVTIRNVGPGPLNTVDLLFNYSDRARPRGDAWLECARDEPRKEMRCVVPGPPVGSTGTYTYQFTVDFQYPVADMAVAAFPTGFNDRNHNDNFGTIAICTNGC